MPNVFPFASSKTKLCAKSLNQLLPLRHTGSWMPDRKLTAHFIDPMLLLPTEMLPNTRDWVYELKGSVAKTE